MPLLSPLKIIFAGTPDFAGIALSALIQAGYSIPLVLTQADRPAGRGMKLHLSPVKQIAQQHQIEVFQPLSLKSEEVFTKLRAVNPDVMIVAAYGLILPQTVLDIPRLGCINIHASLLPRWRGAAPLQRAILAGDTITGITIMQMEAGLDTGPILMQQEIAIEPAETTGSLHDKLACLGAQLLLKLFKTLAQNVQTPLTHFPSRPQPSTGISYAQKISKEETYIQWQEPAQIIARKIRAFNPNPGASALFQNTRIKIWRAEPLESLSTNPERPPGTIITINSEGIFISCGAGALRVQELQRPGKNKMSAAKFLSGFTLKTSERFY